MSTRHHQPSQGHRFSLGVMDPSGVLHGAAIVGRPATYWRARIDRMQARLNTLTEVQRHPTDDPAAYGGIGIRQTPRQQRRYAAQLDATAAEVVRLTSALEHARRMLRAAQEREART